MDWSDEESLAGLTQEPSQNSNSPVQIKLTDADDLIDCTANQQCHFDDFAAEFGAFDKDSSKVKGSNLDNSVDLFPTPSSQDTASAQVFTMHNNSSDVSQPLLVIIFNTTFFQIFIYNFFLL